VVVELDVAKHGHDIGKTANGHGFPADIAGAIEPKHWNIALRPRALASLGNLERQQRHELGAMLEERARAQAPRVLDFIAHAARNIAVGENAAARDTAAAGGIEASAFASHRCHRANVEA